MKKITTAKLAVTAAAIAALVSIIKKDKEKKSNTSTQVQLIAPILFKFKLLLKANNKY